MRLRDELLTPYDPYFADSLQANQLNELTKKAQDPQRKTLQAVPYGSDHPTVWCDQWLCIEINNLLFTLFQCGLAAQTDAAASVNINDLYLDPITLFKDISYLVNPVIG